MFGLELGEILLIGIGLFTILGAKKLPEFGHHLLDVFRSFLTVLDNQVIKEKVLVKVKAARKKR